MPTKRQAALGLLVVTIFWGGTFVWMKQIMLSLETHIDHYGKSGVVSVIVASRFSIALVLLLAVSKRARAGLKSQDDWKGGLLLGGLMLGGFVLQMIGIASVSPAVSAFLTSLYVVFTAIFSTFISDRKPTRMMVLGVILATVGAGFIDGPPHIVWGTGELLTIISALFFAIHIIYTDSITRERDPIAITATSFVVLVVGALIMTLIFTGGTKVVETTWQDGVVIPLLCLGLFGSFVCILMMNLMQKYLNPTHAAIIYSFEPVWATLYGWSVDLVTITAWLGMGLLLLIGNIIVELDETKSDHLSDEALPE
tara:strand:+ start:3095 stop:4027 length:933 start_codon:yes stop_codon:yes gene_type:complete